MKAIVQRKYGSPDVLEHTEIDRPVVKADNVLVRVHAAGVNPYDWHLMTGIPYIARVMGRTMGFGLRRPKNPVRGWDVAGHVEAVGRDVTQFHPGDEVFGWCDNDGAFAEYVCAAESSLVSTPPGLTFEQAAAVPMAALTALQGLRDHGEVQPGQKVLINGASGGVGTFAVQIAKSFGAGVTGVCSTRNVGLVRSIGADHVIDYTREDFTMTGEHYDLVLDSPANRSLSDCRRALTPRGAYVLVGDSGGRCVGGFSRTLRMVMLAPFVSQRMRAFAAVGRSEDLVAVKELLEAGEVTPVIDRTYPLSEVPEAIGYVAKGHARGKVVITMEHGGKT